MRITVLITLVVGVVMGTTEVSSAPDSEAYGSTVVSGCGGSLAYTC